MDAVVALRRLARPRERARSLARRAMQHPFRALAVTDGVLWALFLALFLRLLRLIPGEGVKLHGNIDTGVDLYGPKQDLWWLPGMVIALLAVNGVLARWTRVRGELLATWFLLGTTVPILLGAVGAVVFLTVLNARP